MDGDSAPAWFVGDLGDPWVLSMAESLPKQVAWISCPGDLPEEWSGSEITPPPTLVLHRSSLNATDASRLARLRARASEPTRVLLCVGPNVRYDDLVRWSRLADVVIPEATASETLARWFPASARPAPSSDFPPISVLSSDFEWREMMADMCRAVGYQAEPIKDEPFTCPEGLSIWDVPVLEADWPSTLLRRARAGKVIAVFGFGDRELVETARGHGASACLEAPVELEDLAWVLDRQSTMTGKHRPSPAHVLPPIPALLRRREEARSARTGGSGEVESA